MLKYFAFSKYQKCVEWWQNVYNAILLCGRMQLSKSFSIYNLHLKHTINVLMENWLWKMGNAVQLHAECRFHFSSELFPFQLHYLMPLIMPCTCTVWSVALLVTWYVRYSCSWLFAFTAMLKFQCFEIGKSYRSSNIQWRKISKTT